MVVLFELRNKDSRLISRTTQHLALLFLGALLLINVPFNLTMAPLRHLTIVDNYDKPITSAIIRQVWYQYALGIRGEERFIANSEGKALLPNRTVRTSLYSLLRGAFHKFSEVGIHASYTSSEYVSIRTDNIVESFYNGKGLESNKIRLDLKR
jgi:hypothetical protein